jgi:hypothetical protein
VANTYEDNRHSARLRDKMEGLNQISLVDKMEDDFWVEGYNGLASLTIVVDITFSSFAIKVQKKHHVCYWLKDGITNVWMVGICLNVFLSSLLWIFERMDCMSAALDRI